MRKIPLLAGCARAADYDWPAAKVVDGDAVRVGAGEGRWRGAWRCPGSNSGAFGGLPVEPDWPPRAAAAL